MFNKSDKKESIEIMPAKCTVTGGDFDITIQKRNGMLIMINGVKRYDSPSHNVGVGESYDKKDGMKHLIADGGIFTENTYHCPICGNKDIVRCGKCHNITCYDGSGTFKCAYCGNRGKVCGTIQQIYVHDSGMKKSGSAYSKNDKPHYSGDKPYYPGDK